MTSQDINQQSGEALPLTEDVSSTPAVVQDGVTALQSSIPAGPSGPVNCPLTRVATAPLPVLTGTTALAGVECVPPPPAKPYRDYLWRSGRLAPVSASSVPQTPAVAMQADLVTLPSTLPRPFPTFEGSGQSSRAPAPTRGSRKILPDRC